jgi:hypothetical protein
MIEVDQFRHLFLLWAMNPDDLITLMRTQPFQPFTVHLNNGATFDVRHPDQAMIVGEMLLVAHNGDQLERIAMLNIAHITTKESATST